MKPGADIPPTERWPLILLNILAGLFALVIVALMLAMAFGAWQP